MKGNINLWGDCESIPFSYSVHLSQHIQRVAVSGGWASDVVKLPDGRVIQRRSSVSMSQQDERFVTGAYMQAVTAVGKFSM